MVCRSPVFPKIPLFGVRAFPHRVQNYTHTHTHRRQLLRHDSCPGLMLAHFVSVFTLTLTFLDPSVWRFPWCTQALLPDTGLCPAYLLLSKTYLGELFQPLNTPWLCLLTYLCLVVFTWILKSAWFFVSWSTAWLSVFGFICSFFFISTADMTIISLSILLFDSKC